MSIVFVSGEFISIAKADCEHCHGSGIEISEQTYNHGSLQAVVKFCHCITISHVPRKDK